MQATTTTKPATKPAKVSTKPAKVSTKPATVAPMVYSAILADCLAGKFGNLIKGYYATAIAYHAKQKTVFPRARLVGITLLNEKDAIDFIAKHEKTGLPSGSYTGQKLFDAMMLEAQSKA